MLRRFREAGRALRLFRLQNKSHKEGLVSRLWTTRRLRSLVEC